MRFFSIYIIYIYSFSFVFLLERKVSPVVISSSWYSRASPGWLVDARGSISAFLAAVNL
jgi:hypothetical protein